MYLKELIEDYSVKNRTENAYPVYSITNSQGFCRDYFGKEVASKDKSTYKIVPYGYFAYNPSRINVGSIDWQHCEDFVIVSPLYNVFKVDTDKITQPYLQYYFKSHTVSVYINTFAKGTVRMNLSLATLGDFPINVPSLSEQQRIVSELDLLQSIIDKQQAQLKELGNLAQSIFYDMFGDPVENEKGWEMAELNSVCDVRDGTHDSPSYYEEGYPLITSKNIIDGKISFDDVNYISKEDFENISKRSKVDDGDIIMPMIGTIGKPTVVKKDREFAIKNVALIKFLPDSRVLNTFIQAVMSSSAFDSYMKGKNKGGTQKFIALGDIRKLKVQVPPLSIQQSFAKRIEAIEKQKVNISKSIEETRKLFNYTMDKYFG